jgi:hypothetical protein
LRIGLLTSFSAACLCASGAHAQTDIISAIASGKPLADLRLRFEDVAQTNKPGRAYATTLRARLGYQTGQYLGFSALAEGDFITHFGAGHFNDTLNGRTEFPVIADPDMATLNRLQLEYSGRITDAPHDDLHVTIGRQRIIYGDARFIGNLGWRQHEQTFDAVSIADSSLPDTTLSYAYVAQVNRPFGPHSQMGRFNGDTHLFNAVYTGFAPDLKIEAYDYLLDFRQARTLSTATYGVRAESAISIAPDFEAQLNGAYARQTDYAGNPLHYALSYYTGEGTLSYDALSGTVGYEVLEGNGVIGVSTPLASLHGFQGNAEVFVNFPVNGTTDLYARTRYAFAAPPFSPNVAATLTYHDFEAQHVRLHYGTEWDASLEAALPRGFMIGTAMADFRGHTVFPDKTVFWIYSGFRY